MDNAKPYFSLEHKMDGAKILKLMMLSNISPLH